MPRPADVVQDDASYLAMGSLIPMDPLRKMPLIQKFKASRTTLNAWTVVCSKFPSPSIATNSILGKTFRKGKTYRVIVYFNFLNSVGLTPGPKVTKRGGDLLST